MVTAMAEPVPGSDLGTTGVSWSAWPAPRPSVRFTELSGGTELRETLGRWRLASQPESQWMTFRPPRRFGGAGAFFAAGSLVRARASSRPTTRPTRS